MVRPRSPARAWSLLTVAICLATARAGSVDSPQRPMSAATWQAGRPIAIEAPSGRASFDVPTLGPGAPTLVIVSALARGPGPYAIRLSARQTGQIRAPAIMAPPPARSPVADAPAPGPSMPLPSSLPPVDRTFHLLVREGDVAQASNYLAVKAGLHAVGRRVQVYVDDQDRDAVDAATLREVVSTFDDEVFPAASARFGPAMDVDRDGRFTVLISGWLTRLGGGKVRVDGFVRGADLDAALAPPFGNRCDMMYLSTGLKAGPHLKTVVAHEYTHAVTFSRKALADAGRWGTGPEEEGWLDEAIAHLVEDAHGFSRSNIDYRVSGFLSQPERYRLVVDDYYAADLFRSHGNRGATYLFLRWCVDGYGPGLLDQLVRSPRRGVANLEAATGSTFADLFRRWTVALYLSGLDPASAPEGAYRSVDPRGELEDWILAGPRASNLVPGGPDDRWLARGTTAHYTLVAGSTREAVTVEVDAPPEAEVQVTAIRLPSGMGRPELVVRSSTGRDGEVRVDASVLERDGTPVRLGALAWEPLVPDSDPHAGRFRRDGLDMLGIASAFGTSALPARGTLRSRPIRLAGVRGGDAPLVFKAVGTDPKGRRVAAWAVVAPSAGPDGP